MSIEEHGLEVPGVARYASWSNGCRSHVREPEGWGCSGLTGSACRGTFTKCQVFIDNGTACAT